MNIWIVSFTGAGSLIGSRLSNELMSYGHTVRNWIKHTYDKAERTESKTALCNTSVISESLSEWTRKAFSMADAIVFIGAVGIAVRAVAPYVRDKYHDPAVICVDCSGLYCIPILSGHIGGANRLAKKMAGMIGALPIITTATDEDGLFAVDLFADDNSLSSTPKELCKEVSALIIAGRRVGFATDYPINGILPGSLELFSVTDGTACVKSGSAYNISIDRGQVPELGIYVTTFTNREPFKKTLFLIPRAIWLGIGCRRGISEEMIEKAVHRFFYDTGLSGLSVAGIATCDIKKDEGGLLSYVDKANINLRFYTVTELKEQEGCFSSSEFVTRTLGVDNVCERAAVAAAGKDSKLIISKKVFNGVTVAAAEARLKISF